MSTVVPNVTRIEVPRGAWLAVVVALLGVFLVLQDNGQLLADASRTLHELFHDGRHLLGVPCH